MSLRITTLIENNLGEHKGLAHEHGLSFHIDKDGHKLLFDVGQSSAFLDNADELRIGLDDLRHVVLSHGHYDHSGGLKYLAERTTSFELLMGKGFFREKYGWKGMACEFLGNNFDENFLAGKGICYRFMSEPCQEIAPGVHVLTNFPRAFDDERVNARFKIKVNGEFEPDAFNDEVLVAIETPKGLVVLLGCSHPGVKNLLQATMQRLDKPVYAVIGGTHLVEASPESLEKTVEFFREKDIRRIGVSHCTGEVAMGRLESFTGRYFHNRTGSSLFVE